MGCRRSLSLHAHISVGEGTTHGQLTLFGALAESINSAEAQLAEAEAADARASAQLDQARTTHGFLAMFLSREPQSVALRAARMMLGPSSPTQK